MRATRYLLPTLRDAPGDAVAESHKLLVRAGMVRQVGAGIQAFDDLANGCLLVGEPAVHPAHQFGAGVSQAQQRENSRVVSPPTAIRRIVAALQNGDCRQFSIRAYSYCFCFLFNFLTRI